MPIVKKYPQSVATVDTWTDSTNIYANNGSYATTGGTRNKNHDIIGSNFGFSIPTGSTINSVTVEAEFKLSTTASSATLTLQAQYDGTLTGTATTRTDDPTTDTIWTKSTDNGTWTVAELNNSLAQVFFRVRRSNATACTYSVDYLAMEVDYTPLNYNLVAEISETSTVVAQNTKQTHAVLSISQGSSVVVAVTKQEITNDYDLVASISQSSTVNVDVKKSTHLVAQVSQSHTVVAQNTKQIFLIANISQLSTVGTSGNKQTLLVAQVNQGSTVYSVVSAETPTYEYNLIASINQSSSVVTSINKQSSLVGQVAQDEVVSAETSKQVEIIASVSQGQTIYSLYTKEEVNKSLFFAISQDHSVTTTNTKQVNSDFEISGSIGLNSVLSRTSNSVIVKVFRFVVSMNTSDAEKVVNRSFVINHDYLTRFTHQILSDKRHTDLGYQKPNISMKLNQTQNEIVRLNPIYRKVVIKDD